MTYEQIVRFHGHECPGIAIGYRMAVAAMESLGVTQADDEELVAIVENDACGVDALQCVTGCTFGKGNLVFHDYGKQVYTLYARSLGKAVRVLYHGKRTPKGLAANRHALTKWILSATNGSILSLTDASIPEPEEARVLKSIPCAFCDEMVMESRTCELDGKPTCIPCHEEQQRA